MGRVKRYRKIKACDPFSKRFGVDRSGKIRDDPPEMFEERAMKKLKKLKRFDVETQDREFARQAQRELQSNNRPDNSVKDLIPTQRPKESLKSYSKRVKAVTREILTNEVSKLTSSAKRRKEKIRDIKDKKKQQKKRGSGEDDADEPPEFFAREDGVVRPSDRGDVRSNFAEAEPLSLWDCVTKPPENLQYWASQLKKPKSAAASAPQSTTKNSGSTISTGPRSIMPGGLRALAGGANYSDAMFPEARSMSSL